MRCKRNCGKVEFNFSHELFESFPEIEKICNAADASEQINLLKQMKSIVLNNGIGDKFYEFIKALCLMLYDAPSNSSLKKALNRIIHEISEKYPSAVRVCLQKNLKLMLKFCEFDYTNNVKTISFIISLVDNLQAGKDVVKELIAYVWHYIRFFFSSVIDDLTSKYCLITKDELFSTSLNILKLIIHCLQTSDNLKAALKDRKYLDLLQLSLTISDCIQYLLVNVETTTNCRLNAAFAFCHHYNFYDRRILKEYVLYEKIEYPLSSTLCIHSGIMAVFPIQDLIERVDNNMIAKKIILDNLRISFNADASEILLLCGKNILQWTNLIWNIFCKDCNVDKEQVFSITDLFNEECLIQKLFEYVLHNREHFIDNLRHISKDIFRNIINIHLSLCGLDPRESPVLKDMTIYLLKNLPTHKRGKYGLLCSLVEKLGTQIILELHPSLPNELYETIVDYSLVPHVSEFCNALFSKSVNLEADELYSEGSFNNVWLKPLLNVMCNGSKEQIRGINEYILPRLLEKRPTCLSFMLPELSNMWENGIGHSFISFVICMKLHQKNTCSLNYLEFMSHDSFMKAFIHAEDQVRLAAFSLVCENFKSTEPINIRAFKLIKSGLWYSMNCQSPSFRQQLISYMRKLFTRMAESAPIVMKNKPCDAQSFMRKNCSQRLFIRWGNECHCVLNQEPCSSDSYLKIMLPNDYEEFLHWLRDYLYAQLRPGANFPRRVTSLNLLYAIHDTFSDSIPIVYSATAVHTLLDALKDTYENNKLISLKLLCFKDAYNFCLKDGKLIDTALDLASSSKPPDTVTAAFLFSYMVQCDTMFLVLHRYFPDPPCKFISCSSPLNPVTYMQDKLDVIYNAVLFLMNKLHLQLKVAKHNLLEAAVHAPLYGTLACIRNIMKNDVNMKDESDVVMWQKLITCLIDLCKEVIFVVEGVLSSSSPEGYIPEYTDDGRSCFEFLGKLSECQVSAIQGNQGLPFQYGQSSTVLERECLSIKCHARTAQVVLLCCWRAHKEVSLLLGDISEKLPIAENISVKNGLLQTEQMAELGSFFIQQMMLVKHKGAFEQAYVGFSKLCHRLWRCNIPDLVKLPEKWLFDLMDKIDSTSSEVELCSTRRSAGLPFIIQGLLTSEPSVVSSRIFERSMFFLLVIAEKEDGSEKNNSSEVQIHSLNILRTLFRDAVLSEAVMPFVSCGFIKAIEGFNSQDWGVRNSSNLLFSALMTRMFGVNRSHDETGKKNKLSGKVFVSFYKDLYNYLHEELKKIAHSFYDKETVTETKISIHPSLYPILMILGRLYQANGVKDEQLSLFIPYLQTCACSPIWKTRDMAAKALVSIIPQEEIVNFLQLTIDTLPKHKTDKFLQNSIHGQLLQILYLMKEYTPIYKNQSDCVRSHLQSWFSSSVDTFLRFNPCISTRIVFLEIYLFAMSLDIKLDIKELDKLILFLWNELKPKIKSLIDPNLDAYLVIVTAVLFLETLRMNDEELSVIYKSHWKCHQSFTIIVRDFFCITKTVSISTVLEILFWLLKDDFEVHKHYLETFDDFIEFQRVSKALSSLDKRKFNSFKLLDHSELCGELKKFGNCWDEPNFIKQIYNILSIMPSLGEKLLESEDITELQEKLKCVVNKIEASTRDEEVHALILFSVHIFVAFCQEFKLRTSAKTLTDCESFIEPYEKWLMIMEQTANPDNSILLRQGVLSVLQLLHAKAIFPKSELLDSKKCCLWQALLLLLIDDEPEIKQKASELVVRMTLDNKQQGNVSSVVPSKAVELMLTLFTDDFEDSPFNKTYNEILCRLSNEKFLCHPSSLNGCIYISLLDQRNCVSVMLNWMLSSKAVSLDSMNDEQPFDKGEMNVFSEDLTLTDTVSDYLFKYLKHHKEECWIFPSVISCWKDKFHLVMTYDNAITACLDESAAIINTVVMNRSLPVIPDAYFDQGLIQINQRLSVIKSLLPFQLESESNKESYIQKIEEPMKLLYQKIDLSPLKTFFVKDVLGRLEMLMQF